MHHSMCMLLPKQKRRIYRAIKVQHSDSSSMACSHMQNSRKAIQHLFARAVKIVSIAALARSKGQQLLDPA